MDVPVLIDSMERFPASLSAVVSPLPDPFLHWRPGHGQWSILEIVCHVLDEERDDFRPRLVSCLDDPTKPWPPIDPEAAAIKRKYQDRDVAEMLTAFAGERAASVAMLRQLSDPDWDKTYQHPVAGAIRAGDLLASWAAHDALHLRQIAKRHFQYFTEQATPYQNHYAGEWKA